jgi:hypothetical protein
MARDGGDGEDKHVEDDGKWARKLLLEAEGTDINVFFRPRSGIN